MKQQINITDSNEAALATIKIIGGINAVDVSNKEKQVNFAIKIAEQCVRNLDEITLNKITNLKKTF